MPTDSRSKEAWNSTENMPTDSRCTHKVIKQFISQTNKSVNRDGLEMFTTKIHLKPGRIIQFPYSITFWSIVLYVAASTNVLLTYSFDNCFGYQLNEVQGK